MANKRPKPEEIVSKLRQADVLMGQGMSRLGAIRKIGVVEQIYYRWRQKYGGMPAARCWSGKASAMPMAMSSTRARKPSTHCWTSGRSSSRSSWSMSRRVCCWNRKKRLRALADWSFGGGDSYCTACTQACEDCPGRANQPLTFEGWQVWDLVGRLGGQLRVLPGAVIDWDLTTALGLAASLGIPATATAELLPIVEAVMVRKINEQMVANGSAAISF